MAVLQFIIQVAIIGAMVIYKSIRAMVETVLLNYYVQVMLIGAF
jgi:hypothetical protein